jgi:hypothetical protein
MNSSNTYFILKKREAALLKNASDFMDCILLKGMLHMLDGNRHFKEVLNIL